MKTAIAIAVLAVAGCLCALILTVRDTVGKVPGEIQATRAALVEQVQSLRIDAIQEIDQQASGIRLDVMAELTGIRKDATGQIDALRGETFTNLHQIAAISMAGLQVSVEKAVAPIEGIRGDLKPVLTNAAALTKDAQDSWDDLYADVKGTVGSATVAVTSAAQASEAIRDAAPQVAHSVIQIGKSADGIASDAHAFTSDFIKPRTFWQRLKGGILTAATIAGRLL